MKLELQVHNDNIFIILICSAVLNYDKHIITIIVGQKVVKKVVTSLDFTFVDTKIASFIYNIFSDLNHSFVMVKAYVALLIYLI